MAQKTASNKISPFPFEVIVESQDGVHQSNAHKISDVGMMLEVFASTFNPNQIVKLKWVLPISNLSIEEEALVVKKYTQNRNGKIQYLMEVHFKKLSLRNYNAIKSFLESIGQQSKQQKEKKSGT